MPWELLYADDLAVIAETEEELIKRLNEWKDNVESKGMRVNMNKTKVMISGERVCVHVCVVSVQVSLSFDTISWVTGMTCSLWKPAVIIPQGMSLGLS